MEQQGAYQFQTSFFNTANVKAEELKKCKTRASNQDGLVLNFFMKTAPHCFTASEVIKGLFSVSIKESSVRRCLTNLCHEANPFLIKTDECKKSPWGVNEHYYQLIRK